MDASQATLLVAVAGVLGTVASGALANYGSRKVKLAELEHMERQWRANMAAEQHRHRSSEMKAAYIELNRTARAFQSLLQRHFRNLAEGTNFAVDPEQEDEARNAARDAYSEAQLFGSEESLEIASNFLNNLYAIHRLMMKFEDSGETAVLDEVRTRVERSRSEVREMRNAMRADLGMQSQGDR
ncbi:hypothetical protein ABZ568_37100 [Streptomyces olindensis]|uniref:Secreted protein n=1 Tax=Streptomyces olindensis TaxID=358823 RepID=A0ABV2Y6R1_9ACTN